MQALKLIFIILPLFVGAQEPPETYDADYEHRSSQSGGVAFQMTAFEIPEPEDYAVFTNVELAEPVETIVSTSEGWFQAPVSGYYYLEVDPKRDPKDPGSMYAWSYEFHIQRAKTDKDEMDYGYSGVITYLCAWDMVLVYRPEDYSPETTTVYTTSFGPSGTGPSGGGMRGIEITFSGFLLYPMPKSKFCSGY